MEGWVCSRRWRGRSLLPGAVIGLVWIFYYLDARPARVSFQRHMFVLRLSCAMRTKGLLPVDVLTRRKPGLSLWREIRSIAHKSSLMQFTGHRETEQHALFRISGSYID
jgi:hypothetical protein